MDLMSSRFEYADALVLRRIHIDRNAIHSGNGLREDVPSAFVLGEIQKICLSVCFKLHFQSPWVKKSATDITEFTDVSFVVNPR